jgi:hypothetical protein
MKPKLVVSTFFLVVLSVSAASAQAPSSGQMPMGGQSGAPAPSMTPGMMGQGGMMGGGMCPMMRGGMGTMQGMMGGPMMGMMGGSQDPKIVGRMLQMRAEMMRAMADIMARHGKALEEAK